MKIRTWLVQVALQSECATLREKVASKETAEEALARKVGFSTVAEAQALREAVTALRSENSRLLADADAAIDTAALGVLHSSGKLKTTAKSSEHEIAHHVKDSAADVSGSAVTAGNMHGADLLASINKATHGDNGARPPPGVVYQSYDKLDDTSRQIARTNAEKCEQEKGATDTLRMSQVLEPPTVPDGNVAATTAGQKLEQKKTVIAERKRKVHHCVCSICVLPICFHSFLF